MGTRGLTAVVDGGKHRVAQYGQWDHYPEGQGLTALAFCREKLRVAGGRDVFRKKMDMVRFVREQDEFDEMYRKALGYVPGDMYSAEESDKFHRMYPHLSRDHGAKILEMIWDASSEVVVKDSWDFAADSLFCEYAYIVDLDHNKLEVYRGFNREPVPAGQRFADMPKEKEGGEYYPIRLLAEFDLDNLPEEPAFLEALKEDEEE